MSVIRQFIFFLARACIAGLFLIAGIGHVLDWEGAEQALSNALYSVTEHSQHVGFMSEIVEKMIPIAPMLLTIAVSLLFVGGLLILLGIKTRLGAFLLILFLLPNTLIMHHFWLLQVPEKTIEMANFLKNIALFGALLLLMLHPQEKKGSSFDPVD